MNTIYFVGRVHPERANLTFSGLPAITIRLVGLRINATLLISIDRSQISVEFKSDSDIHPDWVFEIRNYVEENVSTLVDSIGFFEGCSYQVEMTQCIMPGIPRPIIFGRGERALSGIMQILSFPPKGKHESLNFIKSVELAINDNCLNLAIADCRRAIQTPHYTTMYCFKALENIRVFFQSDKENANDAERKKAFQTLEEKLNIKNNSIPKMQQKGGAPRHGMVGYTSGEDREKYLIFTWKVIERYIIFRLNGDQRLLPSEHVYLSFDEPS